MTSNNIHPVVMPKWGLSMTEGKVIEWLVAEGDKVDKNQELLEIETTKITNVYESTKTGVLRRQVVKLDEDVPVGTLLAVIADDGVEDGAIDAFIEDFLANFVPPEDDDEDGTSLTAEVEVDGRKITYMRGNEKADAVPILLIHGFGGDANNWILNLEPLAGARPVYALDLIGHGASSKDVGDGALTTIVDTVAGFLDAVGIERTHIVGHSLGGAIGILLAERLGQQRSASLTCIAPVGFNADVNANFLEQYLTAERRRPVKAVLQMLVNDPELVNKEMVEQFQKYKRLEGSVDAMLSIASNNMPDGKQSHDLRPTLFGLTCPSLIIWGAKDQILDARAADGLPDNIHVEIIDEVGHLPQLEAADVVNNLIEKHIEKIG